MKQLTLFVEVDKREIRPQERIATACVVNSAYSKVTNYMKPEGARYWAVAKAEGLSPEIINVSEADAVHLAESGILNTDKRRGGKNLTGSETTARYYKDRAGTRETQSVSSRNRICNTKPVNGKVEQKALWESDRPIVARKQGNSCRVKGLAVKFREDKGTSSAHRGGQRKSTKLFSLSVKACENSRLKFTSLGHMLTVDFLKECFSELKKDKATGVDGVTVKEYGEDLENNLIDLVKRLKAKRYRPLGIPTVEDKIVQMGLKKILEVIYEEDFLDVSYGFRPNRNCHQALDVLDKAVMRRPVNYIVDMDIEKFFDTVDHKELMKLLRRRIADPNILRLVGRLLRTGVMEEGKYYQIEKGTPQGGVLSPLLANIYLHYCLDEWFEKVVKKQVYGFCQLIRYADDFVVCFQKVAYARAFEEALRERLEKYGLRISEEKSRVIPFGRYPYQSAVKKGKRLSTFDFLGFTHYCTKTRKGYFKLGRKTAKAKFRQRIKEINQWLKKIRNMVELKQWWEVLKVKLLGHYHYYGISGNMLEMRVFYTRTVRLAYKWINRRSQKKSYNWQQFRKYLNYNPLPMPKIYHLTYTLSRK